MKPLKTYLYGDKHQIPVFKYETYKNFPMSKNNSNIILNPKDYFEYNVFENKELYFLLNLFIGCSEFQTIDHKDRKIYFKSVLDNYSIPCECGVLLDEKSFLRGKFILISPVQVSIFEYLLRISEKCKKCNRMTWIYRNIGEFPYFFKIFLNAIDFKSENQYTEEDIFIAWSRVVILWLRTNPDEVFTHFQPEIAKFLKVLIKKLGTP